MRLIQFLQLPTQNVLTFVGKEKEVKFLEISPTFFEPINALKGRFYSGSRGFAVPHLMYCWKQKYYLYFIAVMID